jgi:hypothetical protein
MALHFRPGPRGVQDHAPPCGTMPPPPRLSRSSVPGNRTCSIVMRTAAEANRWAASCSSLRTSSEPSNRSSACNKATAAAWTSRSASSGNRRAGPAAAGGSLPDNRERWRSRRARRGRIAGIRAISRRCACLAAPRDSTPAKRQVAPGGLRAPRAFYRYPSWRSAASLSAQPLFTRTQSSRCTREPKSSCMAWRASVPMRFRVAPFSPITMPLWLCLST